jgi:hypothetical protein
MSSAAAPREPITAKGRGRGQSLQRQDCTEPVWPSTHKYPIQIIGVKALSDFAQRFSHFVDVHLLLNAGAEGETAKDRWAPWGATWGAPALGRCSSRPSPPVCWTAIPCVAKTKWRLEPVRYETAMPSRRLLYDLRSLISALIRGSVCPPARFDLNSHGARPVKIWTFVFQPYSA